MSPLYFVCMANINNLNNSISSIKFHLIPLNHGNEPSKARHSFSASHNHFQDLFFSHFINNQVKSFYIYKSKSKPPFCYIALKTGKQIHLIQHKQSRMS